MIRLASLLLLARLQQPAGPMAEASAHLDAGRFAQAIDLLQPLAEKWPDDITVRFNLALAYSLAGRDEDAIAGFRKVLALKAGLYEAQLNLGRLLVKLDRFAEAAPLLEEALGQRPAGGKAAYLLGRAYAGGGQWTKAVAALEKAVEVDPGTADIQLELAVACEKAKLPEKAAAIYRRFPDNAAARERLGLILLDSGDAAGAIEHLEAARSSSPSPALLYALATAYLRAKQPDQAIAAAALLAAAEPADIRVRLFYGRLLRDQKRYDDAARQFDAAVKIKPDSGEAWNEFTAMLLLLKQYEPALAALERARQLNGETPAYHYFRATMLDALQQPKPALESYRKFLAQSDGSHPDEEFKARHRAKALEKAVKR
ncbi:MAG: tetratricopeptide repeat protein [Candidatus Solibacter usitatus]|nr:tetratricopeptide repeat protein [Candidatus Solibacter usitatus]